MDGAKSVCANFQTAFIKEKNARISLNWPQAVLRFDYVEDHGEAEPEVVVEEANEGEKE